MSTVRTSGPIDPPQTTTNVVGVKRIRKIVSITASVGSLTLGDVLNCLPLTSPEIRILKLSVWGQDDVPVTAGQAPSAAISCVFPISAAANSVPGDSAVWVDEGTKGQQRAQIHLTPCFDYRNFWFRNSANPLTLIATFGQATPVSQLIVDLTVQYRTAVQSCPAEDYLRQLQAQDEAQLCQELFID